MDEGRFTRVFVDGEVHLLEEIDDVDTKKEDDIFSS